MPLPSTRVLHPRWAAHHRPSVEGAFTATITFRRPGGTLGPFNDDTGTRETVPYPAHYSGPCRIQLLSLTDTARQVAEEEVTTVQYLVIVPVDAATGGTDFAVKDVGRIETVDGNGDQTLVGRSLYVDSVARGSLAFERDLLCHDDLG